MITIRREQQKDTAAREMLLDVGYGDARFTKASASLRAGRLPAAGLAFVASDRGNIIGTVRLWNVTAGDARPALLLGPLTVHPDYRRRGIASTLVRHALEQARRLGHRAVLLVGDASYYGRFGFTSGTTSRLWLAGRYDAHRLLALELEPGALEGASGLISATGRMAPKLLAPKLLAPKLLAPKLLAPKRALGETTGAAAGQRLPFLPRAA